MAKVREAKQDSRPSDPVGAPEVSGGNAPMGSTLVGEKEYLVTLSRTSESLAGSRYSVTEPEGWGAVLFIPRRFNYTAPHVQILVKLT